MLDTTRDRYQPVLRLCRRIGARLEALGCGYRTAEGVTLGDEGTAHRAMQEEVKRFALAVERLPPPPVKET